MSYTELKHTQPICRKEHLCEWCNEKIEIGEKADYRAYVFDGDFNNGYMHMECLENGFNKEDRETLQEGFEIGGYKRGSLYLR